MYHISNSARAQKTARLICDGLAKCLEEKPFKKIRVNDIYEKCYVSRATFYRMFDSITDVLSYESDAIFEEWMKLEETKTFSSKKERSLFIFSIWLQHRAFIKSLVDNELVWILFETFSKYSSELKRIYSVPFDDDKKSDYFIVFFSSMMYTTLYVYFLHNESESIEEVYETMSYSTKLLAETFE